MSDTSLTRKRRKGSFLQSALSFACASGWCRRCGLALLLVVMSTGSLLAQAQSLLVTPADVKLEGNFARVQLVVTAADASGMVNERNEDLTSGAKFVSSDEKIVSVNERGLLLAVADGQAKITITSGSLTKESSRHRQRRPRSTCGRLHGAYPPHPQQSRLCDGGLSCFAARQRGLQALRLWQ